MRAVMFAGADAMTDMPLTLSALAVPEVQKLLEQFGLFQGLDIIFEKMYVEPFPALAASVLTQVGLFQAFLKQNSSKLILVGCSMGDLAKLICAKAMDIEGALVGIEKFTKGLKDIEPGSIIHIKTELKRGIEFHEGLLAYGLFMAMDQTDHDCLIAGKQADLLKWQSENRIARASKQQIILPYPLHSPLMKPAYDKLEKVFKARAFSPPIYPITSSVSPGTVLNSENIQDDLKQNILGQVRWQESFQWMNKSLGIKEFVNIGPVATLKILANRISTHSPFSIIDLVETI